MMHERFRRSATLFALAAVLTAVTACDDDDPVDEGDDETIVGTWQATSFVALGTDFIDEGMTLTVTFTEAGTYSADVTGDQVGICGTETDCTREGTYTATETSVTIDPGEEDEITVQYTISGSTMNWSGTIEGFAVTASLTRTSG